VANKDILCMSFRLKCLIFCTLFFAACNHNVQNEINKNEKLKCYSDSKDTTIKIKIYFDCALTTNMKLHSKGGEFFSNLPLEYYEINSLDPQTDIFNQYIQVHDTSKLVEFSLLFVKDTVGIINSIIDYNYNKRSFYTNYYMYLDTNFVDKAERQVSDLIYIRKVDNKFRLFIKRNIVYNKYLLASVIQDQSSDLNITFAKIKKYKDFLNTIDVR